jgi:prepilin peptidase CpaA
VDGRIVPGLCLLVLLLLAAWHDVRSRRIPNKLVLAGMLLGLALQALYPRGAGLFAAPVGSIGIAASLGGLALALGLLFPFYALRLMGAGDVKLMAMVGAWLGPAPVSGAILLTLVAGGVLALCFALATGVLGGVLSNVRDLLWRMSILGRSGLVQNSAGAGAGTTGKLPYALAIGAGTVAQICMAGSPRWVFFS